MAYAMRYWLKRAALPPFLFTFTHRHKTMNLYLIIKALEIKAGQLLLTAKQAARRRHVLHKLDVTLKSLKLSADDLAFITQGDEAADLSVYELKAPTNFKVGERIGLNTELNKLQATMLQPAAEALAPPAPAPAKTAPPAKVADPAVVAVMAQLTPADMLANGKPNRDAVIKLLGRKLKAAEVEAAWAAYTAANSLTSAGASDDNKVQQDLIDAITNLDVDDDNNYDADGATPRLDVLAGIIGRDVTAAELQAALDHIEAA